MKSSRMLLSLLCAGLLLVAGNGYVRAQDGWRGEGPGGHAGKGERAHIEKIEKELGLNADQKEKMAAHKKTHMSAMKAIGEKIQAAREKMRTELEKQTVDKSAVTAIASELKTLEAQRIDEHLAGILDMRDILTAEQFKKLNELMKKGPHGKGPHGEMPPDPDRDPR